MIVSDNSSTSVCWAGVKKGPVGLLCPELAAGLVAGAACGCSPVTAGPDSSDAPSAAAEVFSHSRRSCRRSIGSSLDMFHLQISFAKFVRQEVAGAPAQRHDRPRGILATGVDERTAIDDEQILYIVRLLKLVQNRCLGVVAHARGAKFMNRPAFR